MKDPKRVFKLDAHQKIYTLILFSGLLLFTQIILQTIPTWAVSDPITPTPQLGSGPNCQGQVTLSWNISSIMQETNANRVFWELKKDQNFQNLEGREPVRLDGQGSNSVPTGQVTINLVNYGQLVNGTVYYFRVVAKRNLNDVARRSDPVQFTYMSAPPTPTPQPTPTPPPAPTPAPITTTGTTLTVKVFLKGSFNNATKQGDWVEGATVKVGRNPTSETTPAYTSANTTDSEGTASFRDVVRGGVYNVTVSKSNCDTARKTYVIPNDGKPTSYSGIGCEGVGTLIQVGQPDTPTTPPIEITEFKLHGGASEIKANTDFTLDYEYTGLEPTHCKVEECSAFDAPYIQWKPISSAGCSSFKIPTPRRSEICFQLKQVGRAGMEFYSNKAQDSINAITNIEMADYVTGGGQTFQYAKDQGFQFSASNINEASNCYVHPPSGDLLCFDKSVKDASCSFKLFDGKKLRPGWRFKSLTLDWPTNGYQIVQGVNSDGPVIIELTYPESKYEELNPKKRGPLEPRVPVPYFPCAGGGYAVGVGITLTGPKGFSWRDGFKDY